MSKSNWSKIYKKVEKGIQGKKKSESNRLKQKVTELHTKLAKLKKLKGLKEESKKIPSILDKVEDKIPSIFIK